MNDLFEKNTAAELTKSKSSDVSIPKPKKQVLSHIDHDLYEKVISSIGRKPVSQYIRELIEKDML